MGIQTLLSFWHEVGLGSVSVDIAATQFRTLVCEVCPHDRAQGGVFQIVPS